MLVGRSAAGRLPSHFQHLLTGVLVDDAGVGGEGGGGVGEVVLIGEGGLGEFGGGKGG